MARRRRPPRSGALTELPPLKIIRQILLLQAIWYSAGTFLILFTTLVSGKRFTLDLVLSWRSLRGDTTGGWMFGMVWLLNSLVGVVLLLLLIARSKLVLDFTLTLHFIHLVITSFYSNSVPQNWLWWALQFASVGLMTSLGIWSCQWRELRPINFGGSNMVHEPGVVHGESGTVNEDASNDREQGYGWGRSRGRVRDHAGGYEMVGLDGEVTLD